MNFSRFYSYLILFFLFATLATNAKPSSSDTIFSSLGQPLLFELKRIPETYNLNYKSLVVDNHNRLFVTNEHSVFISDGENYERLDFSGHPIISTNGKGEIAIGANNQLVLLKSNSSGKYKTQQLLDSTSTKRFGQITDIGFSSDNSIYFSSSNRLWKVDKEIVEVDSSVNKIRVYTTPKGLIFLSIERGFFEIENNRIESLCKIQNRDYSNLLKVVFYNNELVAISSNYPFIHTIKGNLQTQTVVNLPLSNDDNIINAFYSGSYLFFSTSKLGLIMIDPSGKLIKCIDNFGRFSTELIQDIYTSNGINFFVITSSHIWRFINPNLLEVFDYRSGLKGQVNSVASFNGGIYAATSTGLYVTNSIEGGKNFNCIKDGEFKDLQRYNDLLFTISSNNLYSIKGTQVTRLCKDKSYDKACFIKIDTPKAAFLAHQKIFICELSSPSTLKELLYPTDIQPSNIFSIDSLLFIQVVDSTIYSLNLSKQKPSFVKCKTEHCKNIYDLKQIYTQNDTFSIIGDRIFRVKRTHSNGEAHTIIGVPTSGELLYKTQSESQQNYQTLTSSIAYKHKIVIPNYFQINYSFIDQDSSCWLATTNGLISVSSSYSKKRREQLPPEMFFYSISSEHRSVVNAINNGFLSDREYSKEYTYKNGSTLDIILSGNNNFEWDEVAFSIKLEGYHNDWTSWSTQRCYTFDDLKPGRYILKAKSRDLSGLESKEQSIVIHLTPNFLQTNFALILLSFVFASAVFAFYRWRNYSHALEKFKLESIINKRTDELVKEKEKTDNLLARVLPRETATELKETGKVNTQKFNVVTVLFSDIQGFTKITDETNPENLIDQLDKFFLYFDTVVEKYKIEKIKTIGDAYMCAGGIPHKNRTNPVEVVLAALEMLHYMKEINKQHNPNQNIWDLRIGIDTGPVIAGVVGRNKLTYDIWGSTVNTASRMESSGEVGKINISWNTYLLVQDYFLCTYRGKMPIKNKGDIQMYFVDGIKPSLLDNLDSVRPNRDFEIQLQLLRLGDLEEFILEKLEKGLPKNLYYHNLKHTVDVYTEVELIGRSENVTMEELLLLRTAALLHDAGHMIDYDTHEEMGVKLAREILPDYQYSERQIEIISELILVTKLPPRPKNLLEAIICDSDLDYLGRTDFIPVSNTLYKELHEHGKIGSLHEWNELQIKFIEKHQYFTNTARRLRNVNKKSQLENIKEWMIKNKI